MRSAREPYSDESEVHIAYWAAKWCLFWGTSEDRRSPTPKPDEERDAKHAARFVTTLTLLRTTYSSCRLRSVFSFECLQQMTGMT